MGVDDRWMLSPLLREYRRALPDSLLFNSICLRCYETRTNIRVAQRKSKEPDSRHRLYCLVADHDIILSLPPDLDLTDYPDPIATAKKHPHSVTARTAAERYKTILTDCIDELYSRLPEDRKGVHKSFAEVHAGRNPDKYGPRLHRTNYIRTKNSVVSEQSQLKSLAEQSHLTRNLSGGGMMAFYSLWERIMCECPDGDLSRDNIRRISETPFLVRPAEVMKSWTSRRRGGDTQNEIYKGFEEIRREDWAWEWVERVEHPKPKSIRVKVCFPILLSLTYHEGNPHEYRISPVFMEMLRDRKMLKGKHLTQVFGLIKAKLGSQLYWSSLHVHVKITSQKANHFFQTSDRTLYNSLFGDGHTESWEQLSKQERSKFRTRVVQKIPAALTDIAHGKYTLQVKPSKGRGGLVLWQVHPLEVDAPTP